ncbi:hypothetical protein M378DRAFT_188018 [Amanita muscaria Koide BX008]|uniref:NADPH-dependent diflavin oxidoreductase 1 n=1 Tax=Amanita muscaria (strain Koide BX008) TaxID=946122 RepID=A0A0C2SYL7_AMAMK|nr:hypothetical protein M378DRAFT_188018 [Amanita muscaria Koide BX008]
MSESRTLLILFATETGNAQDVSDTIARQCRRISFHARVISIDAYPLADLVAEELVLFVISTTGSGQEPRSMTPSWNMLLRSDLPNNLFEDMTFAVFGLGDTAYEKFCWPAKKLCRRLLTLGATELCERGEGDDQHLLGIDGGLLPWIDTLLEALLRHSPLPLGKAEVPLPSIPPPRVKLVPAEGANDDHAEPLRHLDNYHSATVRHNERITARDWYQDVRHLELDFDDAIQYSPGDVAVIHPTPNPKDVDSFLENNQTLPPNLPRTATIRELFTRYVDFSAVPRRGFFQYLRYFSTDDVETEKLNEFLSPGEGADELYEYCYRVKRTIKEILIDFHHVKIPKCYIFDAFPSLRPRQFSIASSVKVHPGQIQLCIAIVKYRTQLRLPRRGVCTTYISELKPGDKLFVGIQKGFFQLPTQKDTPIICVGPGTGVAPIRSLIEQRIHDGSTANVLYFGSRSASKDQHYGPEWKAYAETQKLTYRTAFSRDVPEGTKRIYVQDVIQQDAEDIWKLVDQAGAWVYISGSSNKMPTAVKSAIQDAVERFGGYTPEDAVRYVERMGQEGRLIEECWS